MRRDPDRPQYEDRGDAADELDFHLEMLERRLRAEGLSPQEAAREARRRLGDSRRALQDCRRLDHELERRERRTDWIGDLRADLRGAARGLRTRPGFGATAVLSLGLAIGATTALFSIVHGVLLSPLAYDQPERLGILSSSNQARGWTGMPLPPGVYQELQRDSDVLESVAVYRNRRYTLLSTLAPRRLDGAAISENLLGTLGVEPILGRGFLPDDHANRSTSPCLISHRVWQADLGGSDRALGEVLRLEGDGPSCEIVGVLPSGFDFPHPETDVWQLHRHDPTQDLWSSWFLTGLVRWSPEADLARAQAELDRRAVAWSEHLPFGDGWRFEVTPLRETVVGEVAPALWTLFGAVAIVLVIACVNLGGLLLARTSERAGELAVRSALGASRWRLVRQMLAENLLLCTLGGALGAMLAQAGVRALRAAPPLELPRLDQVVTSLPVLGFALGVTLLSTLLATLAPAAQGLRHGPGTVARVRVARGREPAPLRSALVVVESALAVALLVGAGLLGRSFLALTSVPPGFEVDHAATLQLDLPAERYADDDARRRFFDELIERVRALPPVAAAGLTSGLPLAGVAFIDQLAIDGDGIHADQRPEVAIDAVSPGYFRALGVPLLAGRTFDRRDHADAPRVAIVNEEIARRHFPDASPIGRRLLDADDETLLTIVGVVGSIKQYGLRQQTPLAYFVPFAQLPRRSAHLVVRRSADEATVAAALRRVVAELDPALPVPPVTPFARALSDSVGRDRFYAVAMGGFALLAAILATLGLYGVIAYTVELRHHELGLRMALGAQRSELFRSVVRRGLTLGLAGVVIGLGLGVLLARSLTGLLFGVGATDPVAFGASGLLVLLTALLASSLPARRAIELDPATVLRSE
ncbi:MAG TPA: ABC transporter permease [Thermoanaerobaculia bacterium]|nr:ABC transporter permease [Thermoanaerobaculia bacterium]